jgi:shikimate 5-dehydrogenase
VAVRLASFGTAEAPAPGLLISAVPAAAAGIYTERISRGALVPRLLFDVAYDPWPTPLAASAREAGVPVVGGFSLLLHQAAGQVRLMTGKPPPVEAMREAGLAALRRRRRPGSSRSGPSPGPAMQVTGTWRPVAEYPGGAECC